MENSRFKFRAWDKLEKQFVQVIFNASFTESGEVNKNTYIELNQYTGLKDKNGLEIYEYMEIDNTFEVSFLNGSYVLTNISNGDIMLLSNYMENNNGKVEITREYTKV